MKKLISYIVVIIFMFFIYHIDNAYAFVYILIDENGNIVHDNHYNTSDDNTYTYNNGVLTLNQTTNSFGSDSYVIYSMHDLKIVLKKDVYISSIDINANLEIESSTPNDFSYIEMINGGYNAKKIELNNVRINDLRECVSFNKFYIKDSIIDNSDSNTNKRVSFIDFAPSTIGWTWSSRDDIGYTYDFYDNSNNKVFEYSNGFQGINPEELENSFYIENSNIRVANMHPKHGITSIKNSNILLYTVLRALDSEQNYKDSTIDGYDQNSIIAFLSNRDNHFENTTFNTLKLSSSYEDYDRKDYFTNCDINNYLFQGMQAVLDNTRLTTSEIHSGFIDAKDSTIINNGSNGTNLDYLYLDNTKFTDPGSVYVYTYKKSDYDEFSIKLINSEVEWGNANSSSGGTSSYGILIDNSKLTINYNYWNCNVREGYPNSGNIKIINNSVVNANKMYFYHDLTLDNSILYGKELRLDDGNYDLLINKSKLVIDDTEDGQGIVIKNLDFKDSYILSKAKNIAWKSKEDITLHNLVGINETKSIMPMRSYQEYGTTYYTFYDNDEISKYVEIKAPLKVTFKVVNGTWNDGTTEDKIVETYFFGSINEVDVPKDMIANSGFGNGSWDKEIVYDELRDEYIYTYTFKDNTKKSPKKEDKKEEKKETKLKNHDTGEFL